MRRLSRPLLVLCVLAMPVLLAAAPARADEWSDARKEFRKAQRDPDFTVRSAAFMYLLDFDGTKQTKAVIEEILKTLAKEKSFAVVLAGIDTLSTFMSEEAIRVLETSVRKGRGPRRLHALLAIADRAAGGSEDLLLEILQDKDEMLAAQAALALGRRRTEAAYPFVLKLLTREAWQLRSAAARALEAMAGEPKKDPKTAEVIIPPLPSWMDESEVTAALEKSLATAVGRARADLVSALERITQQEVDAGPATVPHIFGIPIYGRRVVLIIDTSQYTVQMHPFQNRDRLAERLAVPGGEPIATGSVRTTKEFMAAHAMRLVEDLPMRESKVEVIAASQNTTSLFGKLTNVNAGTKRTAQSWIEGLVVGDGPDHYVALNTALDVSGTKDSVAWSLGPDEIILMTCSIPWAPQNPSAVVNQVEIGAALGLKARLRMVPIHTVGVGPHPFEMMRKLSSLSGGVYLDLQR